MKHNFSILTGIPILLTITFLISNLAMPLSQDYPEAEWDQANNLNFTESEREANGLKIKWIVIHDIEGDAQAAIKWFKDSRARASSHYVIAYDGKVYQMVREKDIAWHAGNWAYNQHSIGIEHAGYADQKLFTEEEYKASARLVAYLLKKYNISLSHPDGLAPADPTQGSGIIGHDQVPDPNNPSIGGGKSHHYDPGRHWDWIHYMDLVRHYYEGLSDTHPESFSIGVWLGMYSDYWSNDRNIWLNQVEGAFKAFKEAGIDSIYFLAKDPWGYVYYESKYAPLSAKYNWDLLRDIVAKARKYGLRIYPYINALAEGESEPNFYLRDHPELAVTSTTGTTGWVDPSSEEYVARLLAIAEEIVSNYDVDGLQLDRIRMPGSTIRAKVSENLYEETTGLSATSDEKRWQNFLRDRISQIVRRVNEKVKFIDKDLKFSVAVFPVPSSAAANQLQDWKRWVNEGWVDYVCTMAYSQDIFTFRTYVDEEKKSCESTRLYVGIGAWRLAPSELKNQMKYVVVDSELPGVVLFNGDSLLTNRELLNAVREAKEGSFEQGFPIFMVFFGAISVSALLSILMFFTHFRRKGRLSIDFRSVKTIYHYILNR